MLTSCLVIIVICGTTYFGTAATASTATTNVTTTGTQLKTYTDPTGFFTLQYPADWIVNHTQPVTKFERPIVTFSTDRLFSIVAIEVTSSLANSPQEFRESLSRYAYSYAFGNPAIRIMGEGFGIYSIAGYDTYAFLFSWPPKEGMMLISRIGYQQMTILVGAPQDSFDQLWPAVQKMIDSIKITGRRTN